MNSKVKVIIYSAHSSHSGLANQEPLVAFYSTIYVASQGCCSMHLACFSDKISMLLLYCGF